VTHSSISVQQLKGNFFVTPDGATNQPNVYPKGKSASLYRFDPDMFGEND